MATVQTDSASTTKPERFRKLVASPERALSELCRRSLFRFMQEFWSSIVPDEPKWNWHIPYLCGELEKVAIQVAKRQPKLYDLVINIPPGTTKSLTSTVMWPVWCWTNWPWMRFITASYSGALSLEHAEKSRDIIRSDLFRMLYPNMEIKRDKDAKGNFQISVKRLAANKVSTELGGTRFSTSVGGTVTGYHAHIIIVDDPLNPDEAASEVELKSTNRWMSSTLPTRKVDKAITPTVMIMQRLHEDDPTGNLLAKKKKNVRHLCLPGEITSYDKEVNPPELKEHYVDNLLDPVRMDWAVLKDLEADLGQYGYSGQIGQKPVPPGGGMFKVDHFRLIEALPPEVSIQSTIRYWDKAATDEKDSKKAAYTVGAKMCRLRSGKYLVIDVIRGRWASEEREDIIRETAEADGPNTIVWLEQEGGSGGKESAESTIRNLAGYSAHAEHPTGDKAFRADPFSVQVNRGNVLLLRGDWNKDFIDELRYFPFSKYKDQVDAGSGAFNKLARKKEAGMVTS